MPNAPFGVAYTRSSKTRLSALDWRADQATTSAKRPKRSAEQVELEKFRRQNEKLTDDVARTRMALAPPQKARSYRKTFSLTLWGVTGSHPPIHADRGGAMVSKSVSES